MTNQSIGKVSIDDIGGFEGWQAVTRNIAGRSSWILLLSVNDPTTAVENPKKDQKIKLVPNPARTSISITIDPPINQNSLVSIFSSSGVLFFEELINQTELHIQTNAWPPGLYFVQVQSNNGVETGKIIILDSQ